MKRSNNSRIRESWIFFFILGVIMLNYPFIHIFSNGATLFGIPVLFLYLMIGWPASIGVIYLFVCKLHDDHPPAPPGQEEGQRH